ncbi:MAG: hypothetical protein Q4C42_04900, partial [Clostridia bacterium]|nr:hypothetical protein [Clostridia bacterium]
MLHLIYGRSGYGKTEYIKKLAEKYTGKDKKIFIIVPDQFTYAMEKSVLNEFGPSKAAGIKVYSFNRLADNILTAYGGGAKSRIDSSGKLLSMLLAIESCSDNLTFYDNDPVKLAPQMLKSVEEFKSSCISAESLQNYSGADGTLRNKLHEIGLIYSAYDAIVSERFIDPSDTVSAASELLKNSDYFENSVVFFDSFESFSAQKKQIVLSAISKADEVYISFCAENGKVEENSFFHPVISSAESIKLMSKDNGFTDIEEICLDKNRRLSAELSLLEENIFNDMGEPHQEEPESIRIYEASDIYGELEFAASTIRRLVMDEGYMYGDFSVVCHDTAKYALPLQSIFDKWQVPCYFSIPQKVDASPLIRLVYSAFNIIINGYRSDDVLNLLKTGLTGYSIKDVSLLENYVFIWRINGKKWLSDFDMHPEGYNKELTDSAKNILEKLNSIRKSLVDTLEKFRMSCKETDSIGISTAVYNLLSDLSVPENILEIKDFLNDSGFDTRAEDGERIWKKLMDVLDQFVLTLGEKPVTVEKYYSYLKTVLAIEDTRDIPERFDSVMFGTSAGLMAATPKVTFILGAVRGEFPYVPENSGLISNQEKIEMRNSNIDIENTVEELTLLERFNAYKAASSPSERLFVSYSTGDSSDKNTASELIDSIKILYPAVKVINSLSDDYLLTTEKSAFSSFARNFSENSVLRNTLSEFFSDKTEYQGKISSLSRVLDKGKFELENKEVSSKLIYHDYLSASQIDSFYHCPFRYFCQYSLGAKERRPA